VLRGASRVHAVHNVTMHCILVCKQFTFSQDDRDRFINHKVGDFSFLAENVANANDCLFSGLVIRDFVVLQSCNIVCARLRLPVLYDTVTIYFYIKDYFITSTICIYIYMTKNTTIHIIISVNLSV
jgi:hypothetical protein